MAALLCTLWACGCVKATEQQLRTRAAYDLGCSADQLQFSRIDARTRGVRGCGQQVTYVSSCDMPQGYATRKCTWVLNADSRPDPRSATPSAPSRPSPPAREVFTRGGKVYIKDQGWLINVGPAAGATDGSLRVSARLSKRASPDARDCPLQMLLDGEALPLRAERFDAYKGRARYRAEVPLEGLDRLANAKYITLLTCQHQLALRLDARKELTALARARAATEPQPEPSAPTETAAAASGEAANGSAQPSAEARLLRLKGLLDKGLITQEEHDRQRQAIIESL